MIINKEMGTGNAMIESTRREVVLGAAAATVVHPDPSNDTARGLMLDFCSLGNNCEFGIAQRKSGAEPLDLLRWGQRTITL